MDTWQNLISGFAIALYPDNLLFAFIGCVLGTLVGVLPGIGPAATTAILLPLTFQLPVTGAIIMLAGISYGAQYGGTITSVLLNVPGEASSVVTLFDGNTMARKGRGGVALSVAAIGSFVGGTLAAFGLVFAAGPLTAMALRFGPPEFFALMALGLSMIIGLAGKSLLKALMMGLFGLLLATIGMDPAQGTPRFTFDRTELLEGVSFIPVVVGLFGVGDIFLSLEREWRPALETRLSSFVPTAQDVRDCVWPVLRGSAIGFFLGLIPGVVASIATFISYSVEKRMSKYPERFGTGVVEGVAGPETANNAHANANFVPLFTLGIPTTASNAILLGALMMNGLIPGPFLFKDNADFVWAVIASLYIGNVVCLVLNLPLIGIWVRMLAIPQSILFPVVLAFALVGSFSISGTVFDVGVMVLFGVLGYLLKKLDFPLAPAILTLILGPKMEKALRASLQMSQGDFSILVASPIAATLLGLAALFLVSSALRFAPFQTAKVERESD